MNKPFGKLEKPELLKELAARGIYEGEKKKDLETLLKESLHGIQRVPALLYNNPTGSLESINCGNYEILGFEPMHDVGKHIENVLTEMPSHLPKAQAAEFESTVEAYIGKKDTKRMVDYRCLLIILAGSMRSKLSEEAQLLLDTLVKIQEAAYSSEAARTPRSVLQLHNLAWRHGILCREVIGFTLKKLTTRKFYGAITIT